MIKKILLVLALYLLTMGGFFYFDPLNYQSVKIVATRANIQSSVEARQQEKISEATVEQAETTPRQLEIDTQPKRKILLVVGHTEKTKGATHHGYTEYELNRSLASKLKIKLDPDFDVTLTHLENKYSPEFETFFNLKEAEIINFRREKKEDFFSRFEGGGPDGDVDHNVASPRGIIELYGINYWITLNPQDIVIHIHFNDYTIRKNDQHGKYEGFAFYIPKPTNNNHEQSRNLAEELFSFINGVADISNYPPEADGIVETNLIATGSYDSVTIPAVLLEAGYIYQDEYHTDIGRENATTLYAEALNQGIRGYFKRD